MAGVEERRRHVRLEHRRARTPRAGAQGLRHPRARARRASAGLHVLAIRAAARIDDVLGGRHRPDAQGLRRLSPMAREQAPDHVLSRSRVVARARWEGNFWHFQNNTLRKLIAVDELGLADGVPLLVGQALWESCAFAEVRTLPAFRTRNWVLHDRPIRTDRLVIAIEGSYRRANMVVAQENLERGSTSVAGAEPPASRAPRDLFVVVDQPNIERHLENEQVLAASLVSHGFAVFHSEPRSLEDRIQTIRATRCVVLSGGAGVASLVHRIGMPTGVVEIVPADKELAEPYAAWFCREFGMSYPRSSGARSHRRGTSRSTSPPSRARGGGGARGPSGPRPDRAQPRPQAPGPVAVRIGRRAVPSPSITPSVRQLRSAQNEGRRRSERRRVPVRSDRCPRAPRQPAVAEGPARRRSPARARAVVCVHHARCG